MKNLTIFLRIFVPPYDVIYQTSLHPMLIHKRSFQAELLYRYLPMTFFVNWLFRLIPFVGELIMPILIMFGAWHIGTHEKIVNKVKTRPLFLIVTQWAFLGVWAFVGHTFLADSVASSIGWATGSPFQIELAFYHLGLALASFSLLWESHYSTIRAIIFAKSTFLLGAMAVHIYEVFVYSNLNLSNIGPGIIFADCILPIIVIWMYLKLPSFKGFG